METYGGFGGRVKGPVSNPKHITKFEIISVFLHFEPEANCMPKPRWMLWVKMESLSSFLMPVGCLTKRSHVKPLHVLRRWFKADTLLQGSDIALHRNPDDAHAGGL
jgi:hypothetical protein